MITTNHFNISYEYNNEIQLFYKIKGKVLLITSEAKMRDFGCLWSKLQ